MLIGGIILLAIVLILFLPLTLSVRYDHAGLRASAGIGFLRVSVYPRKRQKRERPPKDSKPKGNSIKQFKAGLSLIRPIFSKLRKRLIVRRLCLHYTAATEDAAQTALTYGAAMAIVNSFLSIVRYNFRIKAQDIQIQADFESAEDSIFVHVILSLNLLNTLRLLLVAAKTMNEKDKKTDETC